MLRLFFLSNLLLFSLYASSDAYSLCIKKVNDAKVIRGNSLYIPVQKSRVLVYSQRPPQAKILKYDPFFSLYLIEDRKKFPYPFVLTMHHSKSKAIVNDRRAEEVKRVEEQVGLNTLAHYNKKLFAPAILMTKCCFLEGIVTPKGVISKLYIKRFLSPKSADYADIGIRVDDDAKFVRVSASNPFLQNNPLRKGDRIMSFDGKRVKSASSFMRRVLFSKIGSKHSIEIERAGRRLSLQVFASKRYGGGDLSDTFLESKGVYVDKRLRIISISKNFKKYGVLLGDRLMQVNGVTVGSQKELLDVMGDFHKSITLLFERKDFQFFVKIK